MAEKGSPPGEPSAHGAGSSEPASKKTDAKSDPTTVKPSPSGHADPTLSPALALTDLDLARIKDIVASYHENQDFERTLRYARWGLTLLLVIVILVSIYKIYTSIYGNFEKADYQKILDKHTTPIQGDLDATASRMRTDLAPVISKEFSKAFESAQPQIKKKTEEEMTELGRYLEKRGNQALEKVQGKLHNRFIERFQDKFPMLTDPDKAEVLKARWGELVRNELADSIEGFQNKYMGELSKVHATLEKFKPNRFQHFDETRLRYYYLHLWLRRLDQELLLKIKELQMEERQDKSAPLPLGEHTTPVKEPAVLPPSPNVEK